MTQPIATHALIGRHDPALNSRVYCAPEQQALRFGLALLLAIYAYSVAASLPAPQGAFIVVPSAYALLHAIFGLIEERRGSSPALSACMSTTDVLLLMPALWFDPLPSTPTLLLVGLFFGLASLRHRRDTLLRLTLLMVLLATATLLLRSYFMPLMSYLPLLASASIASILIGLILVFRQHTVALGELADLAPHNDPDTGLATRTSLYVVARLLWPLAHRQNMPVSLLYAVIDPTSAASTPDQRKQATQTLARAMADVAQTQLRGSDILVRYDALHFVFVLLDCPPAQADAVALRLQRAFDDAIATQMTAAQLHISATWLPTLPLALDPMLNAMQEALERARLRGQAQQGAAYTDPDTLR